jgi:hypothetical protein
VLNKDCSLQKGTNIKNFKPKVPWEGTVQALVDALEAYANILAGEGPQENKKKLEQMFTGQKLGTPGREKTVNEVMNIVVQFVRENGDSIGKVLPGRMYNAINIMIGHLSESKSVKNKAKQVVEIVTGNTKKYLYLIECADENFDIRSGAAKDFARLQKGATPCIQLFLTVKFFAAFVENYAEIIAALSTAEDSAKLNVLKVAAQRFLSTNDAKSTLEALTNAAFEYAKEGEIGEYAPKLISDLKIVYSNVASR